MVGKQINKRGFHKTMLQVNDDDKKFRHADNFCFQSLDTKTTEAASAELIHKGGGKRGTNYKYFS